MIASGHSRQAIAMLAVTLMFVGSGCSRMFWRSQADFDAYNLLEKKQFDPRWDIPRTTVEADPRSRFYDPFDPDAPPLPPDDPAAAQYMQWLHGMRGYKSWHKFGESMSVENPQWLANFGLAPDVSHDSYQSSDGLSVGRDPTALRSDESVRLVPTIENLTLEQAVELASIHSRDYQTQLENLYLSALQLTLDQFQFNVRYLGLGAKTPSGTLTSSNTPGGTNSLAFNSRGGISQLLPTGGQWIVEMANNTLWLFSGGQHTSSQSVLSYSLVQPLLFGAGRKLVLENLTFSERKVLYDIRLLARYRKLFFADAVVNTGGGSTSSLSAISPTTSAGVLNPTVISTTPGIGVAPGATVGSTSASSTVPAGYLGLLNQLQQVLNQTENVQYLQVQTERLRELVSQTPFRRLGEGALPNGIEFPAGLAPKIEYSQDSRQLRWKEAKPMSAEERLALLALSDDPQYQTAVRGLFDQLRIGVTTIDILQVATQLTNAQIKERQLKLAYDDEIDQYKFFLGLPIDMQVTIDRSMLKQFELTDPLLVEAESAVVNFIKRTAKLDEDDPPLDELRFVAHQFDELLARVRTNGLELVADDFRRVDANTPKRLSKLFSGESKELVTRTLERDAIIFGNVRTTIKAVTKNLKDIQQRLAEDDVPQKERKETLDAIKDAREDLLLALQNLRVLQAGLRAELITREDFDRPIDEVVAIAVENRLDLMNARARVMDARRNMEVAANRLEAVLNLVAQGNLDTKPTGNHPLDFRGVNSTFQFGVQLTAPIDQVQVRNAYRGTLVSYQQSRRAYMLLEDQVKYDVRTSWRQLYMNRQNFETSRKNLRQAALQFDINVANNLNPKQQGAQAAGQAGSTNLGGQTGLNLIQALNSLLNAQNNLILNWASYERNRINIYRDMDIMEVDERGLWRDPVYQNLGGRVPSSLNEPTDVLPPEPASIGNAVQPVHTERAGTGFARLAVGTSPRGTAVSLGESTAVASRAGWLGRWWRRELAGDSGTVDAFDKSDRWSGDRDGEARSVPDRGDRKGHSRQHEERGADE